MESREAFIERNRALQALAADPVAREMIDVMKAQLLIVLINRLGGDLTIPVAAIDATGPWLLDMSVDQKNKTFRFVTRKKD